MALLIVEEGFPTWPQEKRITIRDTCFLAVICPIIIIGDTYYLFDYEPNFPLIYKWLGFPIAS